MQPQSLPDVRERVVRDRRPRNVGIQFNADGRVLDLIVIDHNIPGSNKVCLLSFPAIPPHHQHTMAVGEVVAPYHSAAYIWKPNGNLPWVSNAAIDSKPHIPERRCL